MNFEFHPPRKWLVTGSAGFIGSNLVEELLKLDQPVMGLVKIATRHSKALGLGCLRNESVI